MVLTTHWSFGSVMYCSTPIEDGMPTREPWPLSPAKAPDPETTDRADLVSRLSRLTPQQLRVLRMLRQGLLNKQIAYELQVGETTVKAHVSEILRKLNVYSRTQAVIEVSKLDNAELFTDQQGF